MERLEHLIRIDELLDTLKYREDLVMDKTFERIGYHLNILDDQYKSEESITRSEEKLLHDILTKYSAIKAALKKKQNEVRKQFFEEKSKTSLIKNGYLNTAAYQTDRYVNQYK